MSQFNMPDIKHIKSLISHVFKRIAAARSEGGELCFKEPTSLFIEQYS